MPGAPRRVSANATAPLTAHVHASGVYAQGYAAPNASAPHRTDANVVSRRKTVDYRNGTAPT